MKIIGAPPTEICSPYTNAYDCPGSFETRMVLGGSLATALAVVGFTLYVLALRLRLGLGLQMFSRAGRVWRLLPINIFLVLCLLENSTRALHTTLLLVDQPRNWMVRGSMNALIMIFNILIIVAVVSGTVSSIPSFYSRRSSRGQAGNAGPSEQPAPGLTSSLLALHLPSPALLFWGTLTFAVTLTVTSLGSALQFGWTRDTGRVHLQSFSYAMTTVPPIIGMFILLVLSIYYWRGFYRIIRQYTEESERRSNVKPALVKAAGHFSNIFIGVFLIIFVRIVVNLLNAVYTQLVRTTLWLMLASFSVGYLGFYPLSELIMLYTLLQNTRVHRQRDQGAALTKTTMWDVTTLNFQWHDKQAQPEMASVHDKVKPDLPKHESISQLLTMPKSPLKSDLGV